jgi:hypothetical protein
VEGYLNQSLRNLEGVEIYRDYFAVPAAIRFSTILSVKRVRECGVVILWVKNPNFPAIDHPRPAEKSKQRTITDAVFQLYRD